METKEDGGPAFPMPSGPEPRVNATTHYNEGMSLRDYFAGQVVVGLFANARLGGMTATDRRKVFDGVAERVYEVADAMLRARRTP